ncbi:MAG TPA: hypothetical protein VLA33_12045, partial [Gemmatimonadota bacterium]|nr:hypothetical protein [Gemmatimonadota bacterium]
MPTDHETIMSGFKADVKDFRERKAGHPRAAVSGGRGARQQPESAVSATRLPVAVAAALIALASAAAPATAAQDTPVFRELATQVAGVYALEAGGHLVIVPHPALGLLSLFNLETGLARPLARVTDTTGEADSARPDSYVYGPNVTAVSPVEGRISFVRDQEGTVDGLLWQQGGAGEAGRIARRLPLRREPVRFTNRDEAELVGWLITPPTNGPHPVAV